MVLIVASQAMERTAPSFWIVWHEGPITRGAHRRDPVVAPHDPMGHAVPLVQRAPPSILPLPELHPHTPAAARTCTPTKLQSPRSPGLGVLISITTVTHHPTMMAHALHRAAGLLTPVPRDLQHFSVLLLKTIDRTARLHKSIIKKGEPIPVTGTTLYGRGASHS